MSFKLYKTDKHSRSFREEIPGGLRRGIIEASAAPLHYESAPGSGVFDEKIDVKLNRVNDNKLNGFSMNAAAWHFTVQTEPPVQAQDAIGTASFGGRKGNHWLKFRLVSVAYLHWPTRLLHSVLISPDYNNAPTVTERSRNLSPNQELADDVVTVSSVVDWPNIFNTPGGGEISIKWKLSGDKLKEDIVINQAAREWIAINDPAQTHDAETYFGLFFEIDARGIGKAMRRGQEKHFDDDFDDDEDGFGLQLKTIQDEFIAFLPLDKVSSKRRGGYRPLRKRFWKEQGKNYLFVGVRVDQLEQLLPGDLIFDPTMVAEQVAATQDEVHILENPPGYLGFTRVGYNWTGIGHYYYETAAPYVYHAGWRFTPPVPQGAKFSGTPEHYATLNFYQHTYYLTTGPVYANFYADVLDGNRPQWGYSVLGGSPATGATDQQLSTAKTSVIFNNFPGNGYLFPPIDVAALMEEVCALPDWSPNNGMRFIGRTDPQTPHFQPVIAGPQVWFESHWHGLGLVPILRAFYSIGPATFDSIEVTDEAIATHVFGPRDFVVRHDIYQRSIEHDVENVT
jgi:hypothetical protein